MTSLIGELADAEVVVCCGSGGVGKTTVAAVLGLEAARAGRRVVVVTIDPARRLADALGLESGLGGEPARIDLPDLDGECWAMMLDTSAMFARVVHEHAEDAEQAERIVQNRFFLNMAGSLSGTQEYMASEALHLLHGDDRFDLVIVDTPPSRHALEFLNAPGVLARFLDHRLFKLMMLPARSGMKLFSVATQPMLRAVGRVIGSDVLADAVAFFQAFAGMDVGFRERAEEVTLLLRADATRFVLVAAPQRDTVTEAVWFADELHDQGFAVTAAIANRMHPRFGAGTSAEATGRAEAAESDDTARLWANLAELRLISERERVEILPLLDRLGGAPIIEIPLLAEDIHDRRTLDLIGCFLNDPDQVV